MSIFDASQLMFNNPEFYNGVIKNSVRLNGSNTHFRRTLTQGGNRRKVTYSFWIKHGSTRQTNYTPIIFSKGNNVAYSDSIYFEIRTTSNTGDIYMRSTIDDAQTALIVTNRRFNDDSQWYHFLLAFDTEQSTNTDRMKFYVNGVQETSFSSVAYPSQNQDMAFGWYGSNSGNDEVIGDYDANEQSRYHINGCLAEFHYVDGQQLTPTSFGEFKNGIWIPIAYTGSHGTIGYHLKFDQTGTGTASSTTIGADSSGNNNHFTSSGIAAHDCNFPDTPENNFCTYNPLDALGNNNTFSEGMLKVVVANQNTNEETRATFGVSSGKWYWEHRLNSTASSNAGYFKIGIKSDDGNNYWNVRGSDGEVNHNGTTSTKSVSYTTNSVVGVYLDMDNGKWYVSVDGTLQNSADLSNGTGFLHSGITGTVHPYILNASSSGTHTGISNFGQDSSFAGNETATSNADANGNGTFHSPVASGYLALCSANLPDTTLSPNQSEQATDHFNTVLYNGTGSAQSITGVGFQPDWVWIKRRNGAAGQILQDSSRGSTKRLRTDNFEVEITTSTAVTSFDNDGFTLGSEGGVNTNGGTYVAWNWKANGGTKTTVSINDISSGVPSIASEVQANTKAGFSIVLYTGTGASSGTIAHGLGAVPKQIWVKNRDAEYNWKVYHAKNTSAPETDYLVLDNTDATVDAATHWNDTAPDANVFTIGSSNGLIRNNDKYIAYCFAEIEGYSKFGSYTGNGSTDGTFVFTGFRPAFLLYKKSSATGNWIMDDNKTQTFNHDSNYLVANSADAEGDTTTNTAGHRFDMLSNGFKMRNTNSDRNANGANYIYMAFASAPFKFANAR